MDKRQYVWYHQHSGCATLIHVSFRINREMFSIRIKRYKTADGVRLDAVHRPYEDVLYSQNDTWCSDTHVNAILFTPITKIRPLLRVFHKTHKSSTACAYFLYKISPKYGDKCGKYEHKFTDAPNAKHDFHYACF